MMKTLRDTPRGFLTKSELAELIGIHRNTLRNWISPIKDWLVDQAGYNPNGKRMTAKQVSLFCEHICFPLETPFQAMGLPLGLPSEFIEQQPRVKDIIL